MMKRKMMMIFLALLSVGITACDSGGSNTTSIDTNHSIPAITTSPKELSYTHITPEEAKKRLESEKEIILLDVRTQEEYEEKHIPNSMLIPVEVIEKEAPSKLLDKNVVIFVYCRSGRRSIIASEALVKMGYTKIFDLGGINDWPYEIESGK